MSITDDFEKLYRKKIGDHWSWEWAYQENNVDDLLAYARDMRSMLKSKEWCMGFVAKMCPECGMFKSQGHSKGCELNALLTKETP